MTPPPQPASDNLFDLLGGRRGAIDASIPPLAFGVGWFLGGESIWIGVWAALLSGAVVAGVVVGLAQETLSTYQHTFPHWLGGNVAVLTPFAVMILVLLVRPFGLFGTREVERV